MNNSLIREKLSYDDVRDLVLEEKMRRKSKGVSTETTLVRRVEEKAETLVVDLKALGSSYVSLC